MTGMSAGWPLSLAVITFASAIGGLGKSLIDLHLSIAKSTGLGLGVIPKTQMIQWLPALGLALSGGLISGFWLLPKVDLFSKQDLGRRNKHPTILTVVLADVTGSLTPVESNSVAALTASVLDTLPPGAAYRVYPIHMDMERPSVIVDGMVPSLPGIWMDPNVAMARREFVDTKLHEIHLEVNGTSLKVDSGTCILDGLSFVDNLFRSPEYEGIPKQLYIISDMIEECPMTPLGIGVSLHHRLSSRELEVASTFPTGPDWSSVAVGLVVPADVTPAARVQDRPRLRDLRLFWGRILSRWRVQNGNLVWGLGSAPILPIIPGAGG
jgi:hypothetical protein